MAGPSINTFPSETTWPGEWPPVSDGPTSARVDDHSTVVDVAANATSVELTTFTLDEED